MERTDLRGTHPEVHRLHVQLLREKSPEWKLKRTIQIIDQSRRLFPQQVEKVAEEVRRIYGGDHRNSP